MAMATATVIQNVQPIDNNLENLATKARQFAHESQAPNTLRAYKADWADFENWCLTNRLDFLPADPRTIGLYLTALSDRCKTSTVKRRIASISHVHLSHGYGSPRENSHVKAVLSGIRRTKGASQHGKDPLLKNDLRRMVRALPDNLLGTRDKAILLLGFFSACRRSELVGIEVEDLGFTPRGLILSLRKTKTDQEAEGRQVGVPYAADPNLCPVTSVRGWLEAARIDSEAVFRPVDRHGRVLNKRLSPKAIALVVKRSASAVGLDASRLAAHSLRSGFCTEAALNGVEERLIMKQTGHQTAEVVRGYIREANVFENNGAEIVSF